MFQFYLACAFFFAFSSTATSAQRCDYGEAHSSMPDEFDDYAFMIGDYRIDVRRGEGDAWSDEVIEEAFWRGRYILNGMAIMDEWFDKNPETDPATPRGVNIRIWDDAEKTWKIAWQYTPDPEVRMLESNKADDGKVYLRRVADPDWAAKGADSEIYFETYADGHWARIHNKRDETGQLSPLYKLEAFRVSCGADRR